MQQIGKTKKRIKKLQIGTTCVQPVNECCIQCFSLSHSFSPNQANTTTRCNSDLYNARVPDFIPHQIRGNKNAICIWLYRMLVYVRLVAITFDSASYWYHCCYTSSTADAITFGCTASFFVSIANPNHLSSMALFYIQKERMESIHKQMHRYSNFIDEYAAIRVLCSR